MRRARNIVDEVRRARLKPVDGGGRHHGCQIEAGAPRVLDAPAHGVRLSGMRTLLDLGGSRGEVRIRFVRSALMELGIDVLPVSK